ncbi:type II toxin-antitoxin system Phd/YefM family antitoxin [Pseudanabaena sp. 'Roaring Creek']|uniref:type II toxin-antitoxin system Phd/YefM family antitoxin n=1 Tax=Pseudanabaena sp. 'Roaring Creek' TaxID=1681830 RepID=UPI0006D7E6B7|nr:type II toxin-antitoxin system Phd/YefM family antitoxin [Pseudanabaena sp. 'Roaring Creek']
MSTQQVTFQECNTHFAQIFERVLKNHEVISVYKEPEQGIVILDAKEYSSLVETLYLLSNQANRDRLYQGILQHQQAQVKEEEQGLTIEQRLDFLKLPIAERRQILESQAEEMITHYQQETDWKELMAGDIIDY